MTSLWKALESRNADFLRRRYRGGRPDRLARVLNRLGAWQSATGILVPRRAVTLEVVGRISGKAITFPLVLVQWNGAEYLVSMLGPDANWVRNVRAAQGRAVLIHGRRRPVVLTDVPVEARPPIIRRYLELAPGGRPHIPVDKSAPLEAFAGIAADYPVFKIVSPTDSESAR